MTPKQHRLYIFERLKKEGFKYLHDTVWLDPSGEQATWTFDFKHLFLDREFLFSACELFWDQYDKEKPIQIGGMETASIPFIAALIMTGKRATGFYIRKSRKKKYDLRQLEGVLNDAPIVLVDDVLNSGLSTERQIEVLRRYYRDVYGVFACVRLRPPEYYDYLRGMGINLTAIFNITDFGEPYKRDKESDVRFDEEWRAETPSPHLFNVARRPQMHVGDCVYVNADDGNVYAFYKGDGSIKWKTRIQRLVPANLNQPGMREDGDVLYVGSEYGVIFSLDAHTGEELWKKSVLDHIYGELTYLSARKLLLVLGREAGKSKAIALDVFSKEKVWEYQEPSEQISSSTYVPSMDMFVLATSGGLLRAFQGMSGRALWTLQVEGGISDKIWVDDSAGRGFFITGIGKLYEIKLSNGSIVRARQISAAPFFSAMPIVAGDCIYLTALHRTLYCVDRGTFEQKWSVDTKGRIFGRPTIVGGTVYVGNNEGILYAFNAENGTLKGKQICTERIVSEPFFETDGHTLFVCTIAGEVYKLSMRQGEVLAT